MGNPCYVIGLRKHAAQKSQHLVDEVEHQRGCVVWALTRCSPGAYVASTAYCKQSIQGCDCLGQRRPALLLTGSIIVPIGTKDIQPLKWSGNRSQE